MHRTRRSLLHVFWLLMCATLLPAVGADPGVKATLSSPTVAVGESVTYELTVEGDFKSQDAPVPVVDGLEVRGTQYGSQMLIVNGDFSRRATVAYTLVPTRAGTFTIPPLEVPVEGKKLKTRELKLTVTAAQQTTQAGDFAFAEIRLAKKNPYIGEAIGIEVRLYLDATARWNLSQRPVLSGTGFTLKPFGKLSERLVELAGKSYHEAKFQSVIIPGKAGKITVGPLPVKTVYSTGGRRRGPFDIIQQGNVQELEVVAPAIEMEAQLLPSEGRPASFSGAVGKFDFQGSGSPNRVNMGEPVEMVLKVTGEGNFDRIGTPALAEPDGWRVYDAKEEFEAGDELGYTGTKTFSLPVAPTTRKTTMPVFSFTYFDPESAKYREIKSGTFPLAVIGAEPPAPAPAVAAPPVAPPPAPEPAAAQDILGILPPGGLAWNPGVPAQTLYLLLAAPVPVLAALVYWRRRAGDARARRVQQLKREKASVVQQIRAATRSEELYDAAAHALQLDAALASGKEARACDLVDILAARQLTAAIAEAVEDLFNARAAFAYAGGTRDESPARPTDRDRVLDIINAYERSQPR